MTGDANQEDEMQAIEELLPWYAAGTLDAAQTRRVEEALAREPRLQVSLRVVREDREETLSLNQSAGAPGAQVWAHVLAATQAEPRAPTLKIRLASIIASTAAWAIGAPTRLVWIGATAAVVIVLQSAALVSLLPAIIAPTYQTASQHSTSSEGATVIVGFAPDVTMQQIVQLLQKHKATIVDGPRTGGLFRLRVGEKTMSKDELASIVADLRGEAAVRLVLPSGGGQ
jgi:anti-sigma-K factor RskA